VRQPRRFENRSTQRVSLRSLRTLL
jgi:hypothetical protein